MCLRLARLFYPPAVPLLPLLARLVFRVSGYRRAVALCSDLVYLSGDSGAPLLPLQMILLLWLAVTVLLLLSSPKAFWVCKTTLLVVLGSVLVPTVVVWTELVSIPLSHPVVKVLVPLVWAPLVVSPALQLACRCLAWWATILLSPFLVTSPALLLRLIPASSFPMVVTLRFLNRAPKLLSLAPAAWSELSSLAPPPPRFSAVVLIVVVTVARMVGLLRLTRPLLDIRRIFWARPVCPVGTKKFWYG